MDITRNTRNAKNELMTYFRSESENLKSILNQKLDHKGKAKILNSKLVSCKEELILATKKPSIYSFGNIVKEPSLL